MNTLEVETKVENITLAGVIDDANVRLSITRNKGQKVRQISLSATKADVSVNMDWYRESRHINMTVNNCELGDVPMELIIKLLHEMQAVENTEEF